MAVKKAHHGRLFAAAVDQLSGRQAAAHLIVTQHRRMGRSTEAGEEHHRHIRRQDPVDGLAAQGDDHAVHPACLKHGYIFRCRVIDVKRHIEHHLIALFRQTPRKLRSDLRIVRTVQCGKEHTNNIGAFVGKGSCHFAGAVVKVLHCLPDLFPDLFAEVSAVIHDTGYCRYGHTGFCSHISDRCHCVPPVWSFFIHFKIQIIYLYFNILFQKCKKADRCVFVSGDGIFPERPFFRPFLTPAGTETEPCP